MFRSQYRDGFLSFELQILTLCALGVCMLLNFFAINRLSSRGTVDDSKFSYIDDDHPTELPMHIDNVAMMFENTDHYRTADPMSWYDWHSLDHFPHGHGFVRLGPNGRVFGVSMFHQIHCLDMIREALIHGANGHSGHCLNFLRQAVLCNADITLDPLNMVNGTDGTGVTHVCRDWTKVYDFVNENQLTRDWDEPTHNYTM